MTRRLLLADLAVAAVFALVVLIVAPGLAVVGIFAVLVIVGCVASVVIARIRVVRARRSAPTRTASRRPGPGNPREPGAR